MKKIWRKLIILFTIATITVAIFTAIQIRTPNNSSLTQPFAEVLSKGNSEIITFIPRSDTGMTFSYRIGSEINPVVSAGHRTTDTTNLFNLRGMEYIEIEVAPNVTGSFTVTLLFAIPEFTIPSLWFTHRLLYTEVSTIPNKTIYKIPLKEMHTPIWWYTINRISRESIPRKIDWSRCSGYSINNHDLNARGEILTIYLRNIRFLPSKLKIAAITLTLLFILSTIWFILSMLERQGQFIYEPVKLVDEKSKTRQSLLNFLGSHYRTEGLSMEKVSKESGIPPQKIRDIMKETHQMTLNDYITMLRITESARLLEMSTLQIAEIAHTIGYSHVSTFNHLFKKRFSMSPSKYRKEKQSGS